MPSLPKLGFLFSLFLAIGLTPVKGDEYPSISVADLKAAIAEGSVTIIDVNGSTMYRKGHIPTAIDFRADQDQLASLLPADKNRLVVAYCGGPECTAYQAAAEKVQKLGYRNVKHLSSGIVGWIKAGEALEKGKKP